eukprot:m.95995 g.95995  ORF g.95995 m.95995 type:complete len:93 (-) comp20441_c0_seq6:60-338(-)
MLPLHISESGADFALRWNSTDSSGNPRGLPRPTLDQDRAYAYASAAHQIENIAIGVSTTYAFNFVYYEEVGPAHLVTQGSHALRLYHVERTR